MMQMFDDKREIIRIFTEAHSWIVDRDGVDKIEICKEAGECGYVPWFAIHIEGEIASRVNGKYVVFVGYR